MNLNLIKKTCSPCKKGTPPLKDLDLIIFFKELEIGWTLTGEHHIEKTYLFKNFKESLAFVNKIGTLAEKEGHHPDILLSYGKVEVKLYTHKIDGLSENDFIFASKCDDLLKSSS